MLVTLLEWLWTALFLVAWLYLSMMFAVTAWTGKFSYWRKKANGRGWPPLRSEAPLLFWFTWTFTAGPFLFLTMLVLAGLGIPQLQR